MADDCDPNTPENAEINATEILSTECVASEGKLVRQNTCSVCGAFGHNKKFHKKNCKICRSAGHVSFRCPNKSTAKASGFLPSANTDELHFPEKERRGTKQDLTQGEMDIAARVLLCCHNEKKWKEIQSVKDISLRASMYTGISKATCAAIYKQLKVGQWPEKGPSKRGKYDRETHNLKKKPDLSCTKSIRNNKIKKSCTSYNAVDSTAESCMNSYTNIATVSQMNALNDITVTTLPMQISSLHPQQNYSFNTDTVQTESTIYTNLLANQNCVPNICDQTNFQGMVTQNVSSIQQQHQQHQQQHQQQQTHQQHEQQLSQLQQHQVDGYFIQQVPA